MRVPKIWRLFPPFPDGGRGHENFGDNALCHAGEGCGVYRIWVRSCTKAYYALSSLDDRRSTLTGITGSIDGDAGRPQRTVRFPNPAATQFNFPAGIKLGPSDTPMP